MQLSDFLEMIRFVVKDKQLQIRLHHFLFFSCQRMPHPYFGDKLYNLFIYLRNIPYIFKGQ